MKIANLEQLGLNAKQAKTYTACLELGNASAARVAEQAKLPKTTVYDTLQDLIRMGLVSVYLKKNRKMFCPADPGIFKDKIEKQQEAFEQIFPQLNALYGAAGQKPNVRYFEGREGLRVVIKEILSEAREMIGIGSPEIIFQKLSEYFPNFAQERLKKKIPIKLILSDSPTARERQQSGYAELRKVNILKTEKPFETLTWVWNDKVCIVSLGTDLMILVIKSREISNTFQMIFNTITEKR